MLVDNGVRGDSRVQKEAASAAEAGWDVILLGRSTTAQAETWTIGQAQVRLIPMPDADARFCTEDARLPDWLTTATRPRGGFGPTICAHSFEGVDTRP